MSVRNKSSILSSVITVLIIAIPVTVVTQLVGLNIGTAGVGVLIGILYAFIRYKRA
jgi:hypothetical protein